jgi:hypothetical protein
MNKTLTESQVQRLVGRKIPALMYNELADIKNIDTTLDRHGAVLILYVTDMAQKMGHWTCLLRTVDNKGNVVNELFDPYGTKPDHQFRVPAVIDMPRMLSAMLAESPYTTTYNHYQFQVADPEVATCGRHCAMRIVMSHLPLKEYKRLMDGIYKEHGLHYDEAAVELTE